MTPIRIDDDKIVFAAILVRGIPTIPNKMKKVAEQLLKKIGKSVKDYGGDEIETYFFSDQHITEEEAEELEKLTRSS